VVASKAKTAQYRTVPICDNLLEWLAPYYNSAGPVMPRRDARKMIKKTQADAGLESWGNEHSNALRHSWCTYYYAMTENAHESCARSGAHECEDVLSPLPQPSR
jgi:hypothetical protein